MLDFLMWYVAAYGMWWVEWFRLSLPWLKVRL